MNEIGTHKIIEQISFTVPLGPSVNAAYPHTVKRSKTGVIYAKRVSSEELTLFKAEVWAILSELHLKEAWTTCRAVGYTIGIYVAQSRADASNYLKAYEDAVTSVLGFDDQYIVSGSFEKFVDPHIPRIEGTWYRYER